jgi:hypothetical protein
MLACFSFAENLILRAIVTEIFAQDGDLPLQSFDETVALTVDIKDADRSVRRAGGETLAYFMKSNVG